MWTGVFCERGDTAACPDFENPRHKQISLLYGTRVRRTRVIRCRQRLSRCCNARAIAVLEVSGRWRSDRRCGEGDRWCKARVGVRMKCGGTTRCPGVYIKPEQGFSRGNVVVPRRPKESWRGVVHRGIGSGARRGAPRLPWRAMQAMRSEKLTKVGGSVHARSPPALRRSYCCCCCCHLADACCW